MTDDRRQTGLSVIDHAPEAVAEWLNLLQDDLGWTDRHRAFRLLRVTLQAIRDFLTVDEAADLAAQLPILIRGLYFEGWVPSRTPAHPRGSEAFLERIVAAFEGNPLTDPDIAIASVFAVLRRQIGTEQYDQIVMAMRKPMRDLWM